MNMEETFDLSSRVRKPNGRGDRSDVHFQYKTEATRADDDLYICCIAFVLISQRGTVECFRSSNGEVGVSIPRLGDDSVCFSKSFKHHQICQI